MRVFLPIIGIYERFVNYIRATFKMLTIDAQL